MAFLFPSTKFNYKVESNQMKMLQMLSSGARQNIIYECLNSSPFGMRFTTSNDNEIDSANRRYKRTTFIDVIDDCVSRIVCMFAGLKIHD